MSKEIQEMTPNPEQNLLGITSDMSNTPNISPNGEAIFDVKAYKEQLSQGEQPQPQDLQGVAEVSQKAEDNVALKAQLDGMPAAEQLQFLKRMGYLAEDAVLPIEGNAETNEALEKQRENTTNLDNVDDLAITNDQQNQEQTSTLSASDIDEILAKSREGIIFKDKDETGNQDQSEPNSPEKDGKQDNLSEEVSAQIQQLTQDLEKAQEQKTEWLQEKQEKEIAIANLQREKELAERKYQMAVNKLNGFETNTELVEIKDPFIRNLNTHLGEYKQEANIDNTLEVLHAAAQLFKNVTGGLDITDKIIEYQETVSGKNDKDVKPVNQYNYNLAKNKSQPKETESPIVPTGVEGRAV